MWRVERPANRLQSRRRAAAPIRGLPCHRLLAPDCSCARQRYSSAPPSDDPCHPVGQRNPLSCIAAARLPVKASRRSPRLQLCPPHHASWMPSPCRTRSPRSRPHQLLAMMMLCQACQPVVRHSPKQTGGAPSTWTCRGSHPRATTIYPSLARRPPHPSVMLRRALLARRLQLPRAWAGRRRARGCRRRHLRGRAPRSRPSQPLSPVPPADPRCRPRHRGEQRPA